MRDRPPPATGGLTLVELLVSAALLGGFLVLASGLLKGVAVQRISSEKKLKLQANLQQNLFRIENDFYSARRSSLGNVLCNLDGLGMGASSCDPGFDFLTTIFTDDSAAARGWYTPPVPFVPAGIPNVTPGSIQAYVDRSPGWRLHGKGSLAITFSRGNTAYAVRSPPFGGLQNQTYVMAGWVRGDAAGALALSPVIEIRNNSGTLIAATPAPIGAALGAWTYVTVTFIGVPGWTYNVFLQGTIASVAPLNAPLTCGFDDITVTPALAIADMNFLNARNGASYASLENLNTDSTQGMVFFRTDPVTGYPQKISYVYGANAFDMWWNSLGWVCDDPDIFRSLDVDPTWSNGGNLSRLTNVQRIKVSWIGNPSLGAQRPIKVETTVQERDVVSSTFTLTRTLFPPSE